MVIRKEVSNLYALCRFFSLNRICMFFLMNNNQLIITCMLQFVQAFIEIDTRPCVRRGIKLLLIVEYLVFPVRQLFTLGYTFVKDIGVQLLEAHVLDAQRLHIVLEVDEIARFERRTLMQHQHVIAQRKPHFRNGRIFEEPFNTVWYTDDVQSEQKTYFTVARLQKCNFMVLSLPEDGARLGINADDVTREQVINRFLSLSFIQDNDNLAWKSNSWQLRYSAFVEFVV